jgi:D-tagatose-1,6-bisphosphate aldolase subunit GatZ/KbaZ
MNDTLHPIKHIVKCHKQGTPIGIYSICSANELVIEAAMERTLKNNDLILIEATANQVNQYGGYTGMKPADFRDFISSIAQRTGFPEGKIILGGDHLGPLTWKDKAAKIALEESKELIKQFVLAGFTKIHIDTSMHLGDDDKSVKLATSIVADRGALLCETAEKAFIQLKKVKPDTQQPVYIVGSEVPIPGGAQAEEGVIQITKPDDFEETVELFKDAFYRYDLSNAWENVIAVVVQPGVEFGDVSIHEYNRESAKDLTAVLTKYPNLVFEGHSTDYQTSVSLKMMVEDGIAILKVGPALTYALREGLFALNLIENELFRFNPYIDLSNFINVLDAAMARNPENWKRHYSGSGSDIRLARKYSFSDRCRYYLPEREVNEAMNSLFKNLGSVDIPLTLVSEYMPVQYNKIRNGMLKKDPLSLVKDKVVNCIDDYIYAIKP